MSQRGFTSFSRNPAERKEDGKKMYGRKMKSGIVVTRLHLLTNHFLTNLHGRRSYDRLKSARPTKKQNVSSTENSDKAKVKKKSNAEVRLSEKPNFPATLRLSLFIRALSEIRGRPLASRDQFLHDVAVDISQAEVATGVPVGQLFVVESQQVQHGRMEVMHMDAVLNGVPTEFIGRAVDVATLHAAASQPHREPVVIVIAALTDR